MKVLIPVQGVVVHRNGKSISPPLNEPFEFTDGEADDIGKMNPNAVRAPINEGGDEAPAKAPAPAAAGKKAAAPAPSVSTDL